MPTLQVLCKFEPIGSKACVLFFGSYNHVRILIKEWEYSTVSKNEADRSTFKIIKHSKTSIVSMDVG